MVLQRKQNKRPGVTKNVMNVTQEDRKGNAAGRTTRRAEEEQILPTIVVFLTRTTIEAHQPLFFSFFLEISSKFGSSRPLPKTDLDKNKKTATG